MFWLITYESVYVWCINIGQIPKKDRVADDILTGRTMFEVGDNDRHSSAVGETPKL
jgi:hypothetical protein